MSVMGRFAKLDSSLQRGLDNSFAFVFGGKVVPAEIEELLKEEAEDNVVRTYEGAVEAPNEFRVAVSAKDFKNLSHQAPNLGNDFADRLSRFFRNRGWVAVGPVVVEIYTEQGLRTGQLKAFSNAAPNTKVTSGFAGIKSPRGSSRSGPRHSEDRHSGPLHAESRHENRHAVADYVNPSHNSYEDNYNNDWESDFASSEASASAAAPQAPVEHPPTSRSAAPRAAGYSSPPPESHAADPSDYDDYNRDFARMSVVNLMLQDGSSRTYMVQEGSNIIGRGNDADFRLPDTGVSRKHAEITWDGRDAILVDLQSTNGTTVNDMPVENWLLADGDVIAVGHSYIEVRIVAD